MPSEFELERQQLAEHLRLSTQIEDSRILRAFALVPRHDFLAPEQHAIAYEDRALPLDEGQTVSQPSMLAIMLAELGCEPGNRALEIGAGSGYAAALLGQLVAKVHAVELRPQLAQLARSNLARSGARNVQVACSDGNLGLVEHAPFERILVSAAPERVPSALLEQLAEGGRIAIPVGDQHAQRLMIGQKTGAQTVAWREAVHCLFVPLVSATPQP